MAAQCRLRVTQALPFSYRMLGGGSPQLSWREAGVRTGLLLSEAPSWGYTRAQPERDSGSVCRLLSPAHEGSCGQHRQNLLGDCSFLFPKTSLDVVRVPSPLFTRCRISSRALQPLCVCVCFLVCFFFFFLQGRVLGLSSFSGQYLSSGLSAV